MKRLIIIFNSTLLPATATLAAGLLLTIIVAVFDLTNQDSSRSIVGSLVRAISIALPWLGWALAISIIGERIWQKNATTKSTTGMGEVLVRRRDTQWRYSGQRNWLGQRQVAGPECPDDETPLMIRSTGTIFHSDSQLMTPYDAHVIGAGGYVLHCTQCQREFDWSPGVSVGNVRDEAASLVAGEINRRKTAV